MDYKLAEIKVSYSTKVKASDREKITCSKDAAMIFRKIWPESIELRESAYALFLNGNNAVLGFFVISIGGTSGTLFDPKVIFQAALKANASSIIVAHNHPSGALRASESDIAVTKKVKSGGEVLDIPVLDHIIITRESYLSMADE